MQRIINKFTTLVVGLCAHHPFLSQLYYFIANRAYRRDQQAFLAGRAAYTRSLSAANDTLALLRRNIHRIEKGMVMRPLRQPFALDYIDETVTSYKTAIDGMVNRLEISWATDVLDEYFRMHDHIDAVTDAKQVYASARDARVASGKLIPYRNTTIPLPDLDVQTLWNLAKKRRSVRWFLQQPVPRELIDKAIEIGAQAPSACNRQAFVFRVFDDPVLIGKIASIPYGTAGFSHNVPVIVVVVGQQRHFFSERDRHLIYIDAALATMGTLLALETQGISSCCINWPDLANKEAEMATILRLKPDERPIMLIAIGHADPDGLVPYSQKKSLDVIRRYNLE